MNIAPNRTMPTTRRWATVALSLTGVALVAACGSMGINGSGNSSAPAASGSPAGAGSSSSMIPCAQITQLRSSLTDLDHTSVSPMSAGRIAADLAKAEVSLDALKSQATGPFATEANQLSSSLNAIKVNAETFAKTPTPSNEANLSNAVNSFKSTAGPVIKEMQTLCPSS